MPDFLFTWRSWSLLCLVLGCAGYVGASMLSEVLHVLHGTAAMLLDSFNAPSKAFPAGLCLFLGIIFLEDIGDVGGLVL